MLCVCARRLVDVPSHVTMWMQLSRARACLPDIISKHLPCTTKETATDWQNPTSKPP